jgi:retron-type reverse transcriptase
MKRKGNLISEITSFDNLCLAWYKAQRGKAAKPEVLGFEKNLNENLNQLKHQLLSNALVVGDYQYFTIHDPKKRTICAAAFSERVLHHALMNICHPVFEKHLIHDTYATRLNKGTHAALNRAVFFLKKYPCFAKLDVRKYFDSIDHQILMLQLNRLFKDQNLTGVFRKIISSYQTANNKGLPIGNLTSQYFANHYLSGADHYALQYLKVPAFIRYMDDMLFFDNDRMVLKHKVEQFVEYLREKLKLEVKPIIFGHHQKGLPFLGYKLYRHTTKLNKRSKKRFVTKMRKYCFNVRSGIWAESTFQAHALPLLSFLDFADTLHFRKKHTFVCEG